MTDIKLTKAQKEVVRKMREGWGVERSLYAPYHINYDVLRNWVRIDTRVIIELFRHKIISFEQHYLSETKKVVLTTLGKQIPLQSKIEL